MKVQYCSDLHLEFSENRDYLKTNPIAPLGEILLLAGDIVPFAIQDRHQDFFNRLSDNYECVYWVPGNHEYYHFDLARKSGMLHERIRENVFLVNNISTTHENVRFVFSTLWSRISPANQWLIQQSIADFHAIDFEGNRLMPEEFNHQHNVCRTFLEQELLAREKQKTVVVTHHVPTFYHYPAIYQGDQLNEAFGVELYDLIERSKADYWLYGHHHQFIPAFEIGVTCLVTNQLGYVRDGEHKHFRDLFFEV